MAKTPEEKRLAAKQRRLWVLYRITLEDEKTVETYQRVMPPYGALLTKGDPTEDALLFNDHDHSTGLYRGRLAYLINKSLGVLEGAYKERTPEILRALAYYLENPPSIGAIGRKYGMIGRAKLNKKKKVYGSENGPIKEKAGKK